MSEQKSISSRAKFIVEKLWGGGIGLNVDERELLEKFVSFYISNGREPYSIKVVDPNKYQRLIDKKIIDTVAEGEHGHFFALTGLEQQEVENAVENEGMTKGGAADKADTISMDVPLFIRALEYAKEDAKTDMDLHRVTENAIALSKSKNILTMSDYDKIVSDRRAKGGNIGETKFLDPAVHIDMDNYKPYSNNRELRQKADDYLKSLREKEFSLEETNPDIKFYLSRTAIWHLTARAGNEKIILTKQLYEILKQGSVFGVESEEKGDASVLHILKCTSYIMIEGEMYAYHFVLKMKKGDKHYIYDGNIDINLPEKNRLG